MTLHGRVRPRRRIVAGALVGALALLVVGAPPAAAYPRPGTTERVSVASDGAEGNSHSGSTGTVWSISADGRHVVFRSLASNLVPGDTNGDFDVFVHDRQTGATERVSVASDGAEGNGESFRAAISADGRHVAFRSFASNLVPGDTNGVSDVFVHDRQTGTTERVSVASDGAEGNGNSDFPAISADGRYVTFASLATNLVPGDTNGAWDVFVHDRQTRTTGRVSVASDGTEGNSTSYLPAISADGRHVTFSSGASNLVAGDTNGDFDVFVHDRQTGATERVSVASDGAEANGTSSDPAISADGRHVAFQSGASNLVPYDTNARGAGVAGRDIFVHDRETGVTERVSVASDGAEANSFSFFPTISADGRHVAFQSGASNLVPGDTNGDVYVHDRETRTTERVSVASDGAEGNGTSVEPAISADGRHVAFASIASNLVPGDTNSALDLFVRDRGPVTGIGGLTVQANPNELTVSGWATFSGTTVASASDPPDDGAPGAEEEGAELTGASLTYRPEQEDLLVRLHLVSLPDQRCTGGVCEWGGGAARALAPGVLHRRILYGMGFALEGAAYEVRARTGSLVRAGGRHPVSQQPLDETTVSEDPPHFALFRCDPDCAEQTTLSGAIGTTGAELLVSVPLAAIDASEGAVLTQVRASTSKEEGAVEAHETMDEVDLPDTSIPERKLSLGVAPVATPAEQVVFATSAALQSGAFSGTVDVAGLPAGGYRLWVKACLGGKACGTTSTPVILE